MLKMYNTLTQQKEIFTPLKNNAVSMYVCGVTVYDDCHIGHARTYLSVDMMIRYFRYLGYQINHVRNITDIDDKIIKRAHELAMSTTQLTEKFIERMHEDFSTLHLLPPSHEPRATDYISHMIELIQNLIDSEKAYIASNGDVYFSIQSDPHYGCLSHHDLDQLQSGARVEVVDVKNNPMDFVLWKLAKPGEPKWASPWGEGRPGWHTECVVMSQALLGQTFDLHVGGRDLIFPHHENELAQAHVLHGEKCFARIWAHAGYLQINEEKMSKSMGNFVTIREALEQHDPEIFRYFYLTSHYRSPLAYSDENILQAKQALTRLYQALSQVLIPTTVELDKNDMNLFFEAMDDDFNTPIALSVLFSLAHDLHKALEHNLERATQLAATLKYLGNILGILHYDPKQFLQAGVGLQAVEVEQYIQARQLARDQKNWQEADRIRQLLLQNGVVLEDGAQGTTWRRDGV